MTRYDRQVRLPEFGTTGQHALHSSRVLVVGAGGLASPALPLLAGAGVGHLTIIDNDRIDLSNLHRQTLFAEADCDFSKAQIAAKRCIAINSEITVTAFENVLTPANASELVASADLVLDCADSYAASYTLSDICYTTNTPLISASVLGFSGYVGGFCGGAPSLRALFADAPDSGARCATSGVSGPIVGTIGAIQAQMALSTLLGLTPSPLGQMLQFDGKSFRTSSFRFDDAPEPKTYFEFVDASDLTDQDKIIELREEGELLHPNAVRLSANNIKDHLPDPNTRLVICCATGLRAWHAAEEINPNWDGKIALAAASTSQR